MWKIVCFWLFFSQINGPRYEVPDSDSPEGLWFFTLWLGFLLWHQNSYFLHFSFYVCMSRVQRAETKNKMWFDLTWIWIEISFLFDMDINCYLWNESMFAIKS